MHSRLQLPQLKRMVCCNTTFAYLYCGIWTFMLGLREVSMSYFLIATCDLMCVMFGGMVVLVRLGCTLGGLLCTGDTATLGILGRGCRLYRCCTWFSSSSLCDRISGEITLTLTGIGCGSRVGGSKSPTGVISSEICSGSKYLFPGDSSC